MQHRSPSKTVQIRLQTSTLQLLEKLSDKTSLSRNSLIRYAIARLAETEGIQAASDRRTSPCKSSAR